MNSEASSEANVGKSESDDTPERFYKVAFDLPEEIAEWANASAELLWAGKTSVKMEVQVRNTPFYVKGVAFGDIVRVRVDDERRELVFKDFVSESGHSAVRVIIKNDSASRELDAILRAFGCSWEIDSTGFLWAIDVSPKVDYYAMRNLLLGMAGEEKIGIQEGALSGAHGISLGLSEKDH